MGLGGRSRPTHAGRDALPAHAYRAHWPCFQAAIRRVPDRELLSRRHHFDLGLSLTRLALAGPPAAGHAGRHRIRQSE